MNGKKIHTYIYVLYIYCLYLERVPIVWSHINIHMHTVARGVWINRVRLPILHVVSCTREINISLFAFAPENLVSRDGFGSPVPRQPAHLYTQSESGAYLRDSSRVPPTLSLAQLHQKEWCASCPYDGSPLITDEIYCHVCMYPQHNMFLVSKA